MDRTPKISELITPTLASLHSRRGVASNREIETDIVTSLDISDDVALELHGTGPQTKVGYNAAWARTWLRKVGAIEPLGGARTRKGVWTLTAKGRSTVWVETEAEKAVKTLISETNKARSLVKTRKARHNSTKSDEADEISSNENGATSFLDDLGSWKTDLIEALLQLNPDAFERLCQQLLHATGIQDMVVRGGPGDGGIDGTGRLRIGLVSFQVAFQAKRWKGTVGPDVVREMQGSMTSDVEHGTIISTGRFSRQAQSEAQRPGAKQVELVDGERLCELLDEHGLGVCKIERRHVDHDWLKRL